MNAHPENQPPKPTDPPVLDHAYDGIHEYDNPLPSWWTWLFVGTIIFSGLYFFVATTTNTLSAVTAYNEDSAADAERQFGSKHFTPDAKTLFELSHDPGWLKIGEGIFQTNCVICHNTNGQGLSCPNLTDDYYINVKKITDIADVIAKGRKNGAMPAWETRLRPNEIVVVAAYVASLRGKNLPGKQKEGDLAPAFTDH